MPASSYRADIDGLRAIAVLAVVVFHAFPASMPGGFVGVDIFFVISGFLISGILFRGVESKTLSLRVFYARRIKRLFPALAVVLAASLALGWLLLFPDELKLLGRHVAAGAGFVSNLQLLSESGYFDVAAQSKPLLHLWSLGVEEQFYFGLPLLILLSRRRLRVILYILPLVFFVSFLLNIAFVRTAPVADFYLPFTRFWEFLTGSLLAYLNMSGKNMSENQRTSAALGWTGLGLIFAGIFLLNSADAFPGWWAIPPAAGTVLVIAAGPDAWPNRHLLSRPLLVGIGLISYPLYLWHWPLLTFGNLIDTGISVAATRLAAVALSVALAWLTWRYVERPARTRAGSAVPVALCAAMAVLAGAGIGLARGDGYWNRFPPNLATIQVGQGLFPFARGSCGLSPGDRKYVDECDSDTRDTPAYALLGDSHAGALFPGLVRASAAGQRWLLLGRAGCAPVTGVVRLPQAPGDDSADCARATRIGTEALIHNPAIRVVVIAISSRMTGRLNATLSEGLTPRYARRLGQPPFDDAITEGLSRTIDNFESAGKRVVFLVDNPPLPGPNLCFPITRAGITRRTSAECNVSAGQLGEELRGYRASVHDLAARHPELAVFDPTGLLCGPAGCSVVTGGRSLYSYTDHLSDYGNGLVARALTPFVVRADFGRLAMPQ